ncbi:MAG: TIGR02450 family Trp-rich protein [Glaciecola sp.]|jgi:tryptophan-rich hypothetical protein|nr:TIGR02450 family Trp-rich protein [Glaciecola sp.]MDG1815172.1 TIGR02450 family Trp-rich protein [Glaciecola sp.]MDG2098683.1 TIGR02450 family Trp-rich protein [Glaciecola sp.]
MNKINPKKLLNSKWTAVTPTNKEKHFMVTFIKFDEEDVVVACTIEAVMPKRPYAMDWQDLQNDDVWLFGWQ